MSKRATRLYLEDIRTAIQNIEEFIQGMTWETFRKDKKTLHAVVRNLEVIGEAANHLRQEVKDAYPTIPGEQIVSMRNKVLHEYFGIDKEIICQTVTHDLDELKKIEE